MARPKGSKNTKSVVKELDSPEKLQEYIENDLDGVEAVRIHLASEAPEEGKEVPEEERQAFAKEVTEQLDQMEGVLENVQNINKDFQEKLNEIDIQAVVQSLEEENTPPAAPESEVEWPYIVNGQGNKVPANVVSIKSVDFNVIVQKWLYLSYLGAELNDKVTQQLDFVPFWLNAVIPQSNWDEYEANPENYNTKQDGVQYLEVIVNYQDRYSFLNALKMFGRSGSFVSPTSRATSRPFSVNLFTRTPFIESPNLRLKGSKIKYSEDELKDFSLEQLRIVVGWYDKNAKGRDKASLVKEILKLQ